MQDGGWFAIDGLSYLLASRLRQNILRVLWWHYGEVGITELSEDAHTTHVELMRNLRIFEGYGVISIRRTGRRVYVSLIYECNNTKIVLEALEFLDSHKPNKHLLGNYLDDFMHEQNISLRRRRLTAFA